MPSPVRDQKNPLRGNTGWTSANELYLMNLITPEVFFFSTGKMKRKHTVPAERKFTFPCSMPSKLFAVYFIL